MTGAPRALFLVVAAAAAALVFAGVPSVGASTGSVPLAGGAQGTSGPGVDPLSGSPGTEQTDVPAPPVREAPSPRTVTAYGDAIDAGPADGALDHPVRAVVASASGGYWTVGPDGTVDAFGGARSLGSMGGVPLQAPIVGMAAAPGGAGYWLVASDGGVFAFGSAGFEGSMGGVPLQAPIVGMAAAPDGAGYWLVASDGGVFAFGSAGFEGSMGGVPLQAPIVGMAAAPDGAGYWLVASDGGVFAFGAAPFLGSDLRSPPQADIVGMAASPDGAGYWLATLDGHVSAVGVPDLGSAAETDRYWGTAPTIAIAATGPGGYLLLHGDPIVFAVQAQGPQVAGLQQRLTDLGYWLGPVDGIFGPLTEQAVIAFQKASALPPDGRADAATQLALLDASRVPTAMSGDGIEVDKSRQLLLLVRGGQVQWVFNTSTGTEQPYIFEGQRYLADTPVGTFTVERQVDGWRVAPLGRLYRPKFIVGGIAIHGYSNVPATPASHGCIRVTNAAMDYLWEPGVAPLGSTVWVHGTSPPPPS